MNAKKSLSQLVAFWSQEAVTTWGHNWPKISDHISARYAALPAEEQKRLKAEADQTILADHLGSFGLRH